MRKTTLESWRCYPASSILHRSEGLSLDASVVGSASLFPVTGRRVWKTPLTFFTLLPPRQQCQYKPQQPAARNKHHWQAGTAGMYIASPPPRPNPSTTAVVDRLYNNNGTAFVWWIIHSFCITNDGYIPAGCLSARRDRQTDRQTWDRSIDRPFRGASTQRE